MELSIINNQNGVMPQQVPVATVNNSKFIEANTTIVGLDEIRNSHIIPVFTKDNAPLISQADFITTARELVEQVSGYDSTFPAIRVSHPIKGRTFEARNKKASELLEHEKTIYYERLAFICEIPNIVETVNGQTLSMCFGGVKAYNMDNLNNRSNGNQHFKFFIGFSVKVCTNLCIWTDGFSHELKVRSLEELGSSIYDLVNQYDSTRHLQMLDKLSDYQLSETEFAILVGKARMYNHLPKDMKKEIPELLISDSQISSMTKEYYRDDSFSRNSDGTINLWNMYNLLTGSVKSSYIDSFLDRNANAFTFTQGIADALEGNSNYEWFLN
ncbi:DUF3871 family protein [bacterium]|nr:DUF3871 family protein [bacterium]